MLEIQFILTLGIHSCIQPYKKKWHNRLDMSLFTLLAVLNGITLHNYNLRIKQNLRAIEVCSRIQLFLAYIPLVFTLLYLLTKIAKKVSTVLWNLKKRSFGTRRSDELEISLSMLDREDYKQSTGVSYRKHVEV